jgi:sigma-B regulation protein RsbU (phosphoserine phosphatase)
VVNATIPPPDWRAALADLLQRNRRIVPDDLATEVAAAAAPLGLDVWMYLVDQEQRELRPVPRGERLDREMLPVESTVAGRVFMTVDPVVTTVAGQAPRLWMPLLDGTERLGVLEFAAGEGVAFDADTLAGCDLFGQLAGHLVATKIPYGDALLRVKRTRRMSEASELIWRLLPPLTCVSDDVVVSAILEPCYEVGGDGFDYALNADSLQFVIFDTAGHHLRAGLGTAVAMSAVRAARRSGADVAAMASAADEALERHLPELRFTTAFLGDLDLSTGILRYLNAGHPAPLLIRRGRVVSSLDGGRRTPLGVENEPVAIAEERIERGDRVLLYTDGITEARDRDGEPFGTERLIDLVHRADGHLPVPETLRRLCHAALAHYAGPPSDDASMLLVEWSEEAAQAMRPLD